MTARADELILEYYRTPSPMTSAGAHAAAFDALPRDLSELCTIIHGLVLHRMWAPNYGVTIPRARQAEQHIRPTSEMLAQIFVHDRRPFAAARPLDKRIIGTCRDFAVLLCAMLRHQGIPARARSGLATYLKSATFMDHWLCEYWHAEKRRWVAVDCQIDALQRRTLGVDFDLLDVPPDKFKSAGHAWRRCRNGEFGRLFQTGRWFLAGMVARDFSSLNRMEMLSWDMWGIMFRGDETPTEDNLAFFDRLAALSRAGDECFEEIQALYDGDARIRVPPLVFNRHLNKFERVFGRAQEPRGRGRWIDRFPVETSLA
jgi:hypothetical protein